MEKRDDTLRRALSSLRAIRDNVPQNFIPESYVSEYHKALDLLQELGHDTCGWRIPHGQIAIRPGTGETLTSPGGRYVSGNYFRMKVDTVLGYFIISGHPIAFTPPDRD